MRIALFLGFLALSSCDTNFVGFMSDDSEPKRQIEQAKVYLDEGKPDKAASILQKLSEGENDSNDVRLLLAAAMLGQAKLGLWDLIQTALGDGDLNDFFEAVSSKVLGTGIDDQTKQSVLTTLLNTVKVLQNAPSPDDPATLNAACIIGGFAALPIGNDVKDSLSGMVDALTQVGTSLASGGCDLEPINAKFTSVDRAISYFQSIKSLLTVCPLLKNTPVSLIDDILTNLIASADKGCTAPTCNISIPGFDCSSLFPSCVIEGLQSSATPAIANDGTVARCEMLMHCLNPLDCFKTL